MSILRSIPLNVGVELQIVQDDITQEQTDAIVNPANSELSHGGGLAAAISQAGGPSIDLESLQWVQTHGQVETGDVAVTGAGNLSARYVIHAVGPIWHGGDDHEDALLEQAILHALLKAEELGCTSISLPAISSGIFGFPKVRCAAIFMKTIRSFCESPAVKSIRLIRLCNIDSRTSRIFLEESYKVFPDVSEAR